jgi:hypothetical protein
MSIYIANLVLNPSVLQKGTNNVAFTYDAFVSAATDNPVTLTFSIAANGGEVVIVPGGLSITYLAKAFPLALQNLSGSVTVNVITDHGGTAILNATLTGVTTGGISAYAPSSFTY